MNLYILEIDGNQWVVVADTYDDGINYLIGAGKIDPNVKVTVVNKSSMKDRILAIPFNGEAKITHQEVK